MLRLVQVTVPAGGEINPAFVGDYVRVQAADVAVKFNTQNGDDFSLVQGQEARLDPFKEITISHDDASAQTFTLYVGSRGSEASSAEVAGSVAITNTGGGFTQGRVSLTNVVQTLLASNAARRYLLIQNNDGGATMRVTLDGNDPTAAQGLRVGPGDSLEIPSFCCTGAVKAVMETVSATVDNVEVVEG